MSKKVILSVIIIVALFLCAYYLYSSGYLQALTGKNEDNVLAKKIELIDASPFKDKITQEAQLHLPDQGNLSGYGLRLFNKNGNFIKNNRIVYNGNRYKCYISLANANSYTDEVGLVLFLDGKPIEYYVDGDNKAQIYYSYKLPKYSMINIPVEFSLEGVDPDTVHILDFLYLYYIDKYPDDKNHIPYFSMTMPVEITSNGDNMLYFYEGGYTPSKVTIKAADEDFIKNSTYKIAINSIAGKEINYQKPRIKAKRGQTVDFVLKAFIKDEGLYSTAILFNNQPIILNEGEDCITWKTGDDRTLYHTFSIKMPDVAGEYTLYSVLLPLDRPYALPTLTSEKICIEVE